MKKATFTIVILFIFIKSAFACCAGKTSTISEILVRPNNIAFILVKIDSSWMTYNNHYQSLGTVISSYKNHPKSSKIIISTGSKGSSAGSAILIKDHKYFLVSQSSDGINYYGFVCDEYSYEVKEKQPYEMFGEPSMKYNLYKMIKNYYELVSNKYTGNFIIGDKGRYFADGIMKNGKVNGVVTHFGTKRDDENRIFTKSKDLFVDGILDGISENYFSPYGKFNYFKNWYSNGELVKQEMYEMGRDSFIVTSRTTHIIQKNGIVLITRYNFDKGEITEVNSKYSFVNLKKENNMVPFSVNHGYNEKHYKNGRLKEKGNYWWGAKVGKWQYFDENGVLKDETVYLKPKKKDDIFTIYYPDGKVQLIEKLDSLDNSLKIWKRYDDRGKISSVTPTKNGKIHGDVYNYYKGYLSSIKQYKEGKTDGSYTVFHENKKIKIKGQNKNNVHDGIWKSYSKNGRLTESKEYQNGALENDYIRYDKNGFLLESGKYLKGKKIGKWKVFNKFIKVYSICDYKKGEDLYMSPFSENCIFQDKAGNLISKEEVKKRYKK